VSLVCPSCGRAHSDEHRFCSKCGVPLVAEGGPAEAVVSERGERARKIKRQYAEGALVRVAIGRQQPEAELIQNILLEEGVPSTLRRTRGFDVPEMLAAGPRDVLVPQSGAAAAREMLLQADMADADSSRQPVQPRQVLIGLSIAVAVVFVIAVVVAAVA
jgi:zinc-ribbon domain